MSSLPYKGYIIDAIPYQPAETKKWNINISIRHDTGDAVNFKNFSAANSLESKEEAIQHCFEFGRRIIDGEIENCTVGNI